jgi:hypothetical protein
MRERLTDRGVCRKIDGQTGQESEARRYRGALRIVIERRIHQKENT